LLINKKIEVHAIENEGGVIIRRKINKI